MLVIERRSSIPRWYYFFFGIAMLATGSFGGLLTMDWQVGIRILLQKLFWYGSAIWLLQTAGMRLVSATLVTMVSLGLIEVAQMRLPGHTSEITDPLLALLIGCSFRAFSRRRRSDAALPQPVRP